MRDIFQELRPEEELPEKIKTEVFKTIDAIRLFADIIDLFTFKFPQAKMGLIDIVNQKTERNDPAGQSDEDSFRQAPNEEEDNE